MKKADILMFFKGKDGKARKVAFKAELEGRYSAAGCPFGQAYNFIVIDTLNTVLSGVDGWNPLSAANVSTGTIDAVSAALDK